MNRVVEYFFDDDEMDLVPLYKRLLIIYGVGIVITLITFLIF